MRCSWGPGVSLFFASLAAGSMTAQEQQDILALHNVYRCMHNVQAFTWDSDIAANAQAWENA